MGGHAGGENGAASRKLRTGNQRPATSGPALSPVTVTFVLASDPNEHVRIK